MNMESPDRLDEMIDAAARELVAREPTPRLYAATLAEVRKADAPRRKKIWIGWGFAAASAALVMAIVVWNIDRVDRRTGSQSASSGSSVQLPDPSALETVSMDETGPQRSSGQSSVIVASTADAITPVAVDAIQIEVIESEPVQIEPIGMTEIQVAAISVEASDVDSSIPDARP